VHTRSLFALWGVEVIAPHRTTPLPLRGRGRGRGGLSSGLGEALKLPGAYWNVAVEVSAARDGDPERGSPLLEDVQRSGSRPGVLLDSGSRRRL